MTDFTPRRRWASLRQGLLVAGLTFAAINAWSTEECASVPQDRRAQCEKVMDCLAIDDTAVRRACIAAAQRDSAVDTNEGPRPLTVDDLLPPPTRASRATNRVAAPVVPQRDRPAEPAREETQRRASPVARMPRTQPDRPVDDAEPMPSLAGLSAPQPNFSGKVTGIFDSILDRQLVAIDGAYLFESDDAGKSRLKVGQTVELTKSRSRILSGRSWRLVGPSTRPFQAFRIRCELDDIKRDDRRKCEQMLDL